MIGILLWKESRAGAKQVDFKEGGILRVRFFTAEIVRSRRTPEAVLRWRVALAARRMWRRGVSQAVLPKDFAYAGLLEKYHIRQVSTAALRRRLAADWLRAALAERGMAPGTAKVAVAAEQMTGELVRTVTELALRHRYILLDVPYGGEELCRQLRREYGVSLLLAPGREQIEGADALVLFGPRTDLRRKNAVVLPVYDETAALPALSLPPALEEQMPEGVDRSQLLAALLETGAVRPGQVSVG